MQLGHLQRNQVLEIVYEIGLSNAPFRRKICARPLRHRLFRKVVMRLEGFPHAVAKRVFRDKPPQITEHEVVEVEGVNPEDILFPPNHRVKRVATEMRPALTADAISSLAPRHSEYTVWDYQVTGFGVRVRVSGHKSFVLLYRIRGLGKLKKMTIGSLQDMSLEAARELAKGCRFLARVGRDPAKQIKRNVNFEP